MHHRLFKFFLLAFLIGVLIAGCSKKEESTTGPEDTPPTIPTVTFKGPNTNSTDTHALMAKSLVEVMNAYTIIFTPFMSQTGQQNGNTWTWTYTEGTLTATFTATRQGDGSLTWKMVLNGTDQSDGTVYNNFTALEGSTSADGKNGNWRVYEDNTSILLVEYIWTTSASNVLTGTLKEYSDGQYTGQIVVVNNPDNSGELSMYEGTVRIYRAVWQANGSGQWWTYDSSGVQTGTGTWT